MHYIAFDNCVASFNFCFLWCEIIRRLKCLDQLTWSHCSQKIITLLYRLGPPADKYLFLKLKLWTENSNSPRFDAPLMIFKLPIKWEEEDCKISDILDENSHCNYQYCTHEFHSNDWCFLLKMCKVRKQWNFFTWHSSLVID